MKERVAARDLEDEDWGAEDRGTPSEWGGVGSSDRINKKVTRYGLQTMERRLAWSMEKQPHQKTPWGSKEAESTADQSTSSKGWNNWH
jgi:hypothetical protein